jgi:hypothetical protein
MNLVLVADLHLCHLDQVLKLGHLEFGELDHILSSSLVSLKELGKLKCRLKLGGEGVKAVDDVLWDVGSWLWLVVIIIIELHYRGFGCL